MVKTNLAYATNRPLDVRRDFGGIGNGTSRPLSTDFGTLAAAQKYYPAAVALTDETDWAALQSLVDKSTGSGAVSTVRQALRPIQIPVGQWLLNRPLRLTSIQDPSFHGEGHKTILTQTVTGLETIVDFNGVSGGDFGDFMIETNNSGILCDRAVWLRWGTGIGRSTADNRFYNITVRGCHFTRAGIEAGDQANLGVQTDSDWWYGCNIQGTNEHQEGQAQATAIGWLMGDGTFGNNLLHNFFGCVVNLVGIGLKCDATMVSWYGGAITASWVTDVYVNGGGPIVLDGYRSELSGSMLKLFAGSAPGNCSLRNLNFVDAGKLETAGRVIDFRSAGSLIMDNVVILNPTFAPITIFAQSSAPLALSMRGVSVLGRTLDEVLDVNENVSVNVESYFNVDGDGSTIGQESRAPVTPWVIPRDELLQGAVAWWEAADSDGSNWPDRITAAAMPLTNCTKLEIGDVYNTTETARRPLVWFNGTSSYGTLPQVALNQPGDIGGLDASICVWGKFYAPSANETRIWDTSWSSPAGGQILFYQITGTTGFYSFGPSTNLSGSTGLPDTNLLGRSSVVLTIGQSDLEIWVNSVNVISEARGTHDATVLDPTARLGAHGGGSNFAKMAVEGVAVFDRVLTGSEIARLTF